MALRIDRTSYYYTMVPDRPGEAYRLLSHLATEQVNLLAFNAIPMGLHTQLVLFPENDDALIRTASKAGLDLTGPHAALLVRGDDELGALAEVHGTLVDAKVNVVASNGVTDGKGSFGYVIYVRSEDIEAAAQSLGA
jgi:hypothetical protein